MITKFYRKGDEYRLDCEPEVHLHLVHEPDNHRGLIMMDVEPQYFHSVLTCFCTLTSVTIDGATATRTNLKTGKEEEITPLTVNQCSTLLRIIPTFLLAGNVCFANGAPRAYQEKPCTRVLTRDEAIDLLTIVIEKFTPDVHILDENELHNEPIVSQDPLKDLFAPHDLCIHYQYMTTTHVPDIAISEEYHMGFGKNSHLH